MPRSLVALSGSAVAAIYLAGYVATSGVDPAPVVAAPSTIVPAASAPAPTPVPTSIASVAASLAPPAIVVGPDDDGRGRRGRGRFGGGGERVPGQAIGVGPATRPDARPFPLEPGVQPAPFQPGAQPGPAGPAAQSTAGQPAAGVAVAQSPTTRPTSQPAAQPTAAQPAAPPAAAATAAYRDGTYSGAGNSRRGGFEVAVTIQGGRIANVALTRVTTQYPASRVAALPAQVVARQSARVDRVSGATYSVQAFQQAVQQALAQAAV